MNGNDWLREIASAVVAETNEEDDARRQAQVERREMLKPLVGSFTWEGHLRVDTVMDRDAVLVKLDGEHIGTITIDGDNRYCVTDTVGGSRGAFATPAELMRPVIDLGKEFNRLRRERDREKANAGKRAASMAEVARMFRG